MKTGILIMENRLVKKLTHRTIIRSSNLISCTYPEDLKSGSQRDICTLRFIAALFTIAKTWNNLHAHKQMNGQCVVCDKVEYYQAEKIHAICTTWQNLKDTIQSEISQTQNKYCRITVYRKFKINSQKQKIEGSYQGLRGRGNWGDVGLRVQSFSYAQPIHFRNLLYI